MGKQNIRDFIRKELSLNEQEVAFDFVKYLEDNDMIFFKDNGYWRNKIYYIISFNDKCVCFIAIKDPDEPDNHWTIWSDDMNFEFLDNSSIEDSVKQSAWKHIDFCGNCGSCGGGRHKVVFGKEFDNVCGCTFRIDNPSYEDLSFLKKMVEIRKAEIMLS